MSLTQLMAALAPKVADCFSVRDCESHDDYSARVRASTLTVGQRAALASDLGQACREIHAVRKARKAAWVAAARSSFEASRRQPCAVCGRYESLTQAHHTFPLTVQFDMGVSQAIHEHDWLCPTHHTALHNIITALIANGQPRLAGIPCDEPGQSATGCGQVCPALESPKGEPPGGPFLQSCHL
jgi:hypothetical protein